MKNKRKAELIEFFLNGVSIKNLSIIYGLTFEETQNIIRSYYPCNGVEINIPSIATESKIKIVQHFWFTKQITEIAEILGVTRSTVKRWSLVAGILKKPKVFQNGIYREFLRKSIILNTETGIFYFSKSEAGKSINKPESYIKHHLRSHNNKTSFVFLGKFN